MSGKSLQNINETTINSYTFNAFHDFACNGISDALRRCNTKTLRPIIICIGSDLVLGDSLGPLVGTMLKEKNTNAYIYGTLSCPITAKEVECAKTQLKIMHPDSFIVAVDAAVGDTEDIGLIKVTSRGLKPGLGVEKKLGVIGDCSLIGVVAGKSLKNFELFNTTRLNLIYTMAEKIADGINSFVSSFKISSEYSA